MFISKMLIKKERRIVGLIYWNKKATDFKMFSLALFSLSGGQNEKVNNKVFDLK